MNILVVFGTRPEAIKLAPVIEKLRTTNDRYKVVTCATAQHREMLYQVLDLFQISPNYNLDIMKENQTLFDVSASGIQMLEKVLKEVKPELVLVQGDTTTAFIASLAAYYSKVQIGHVEAGLRTRDKYSPFPEEINRRLIDAMADWFFAATKEAKINLVREGIEEERVFITGNTVIDALFLTLDKIKNLDVTTLDTWGGIDAALARQITDPSIRMILVTGHRRESFGDGFENICNGLKEIALKNEDVHIIYPVHLNPNVQEPVNRILGGIERIHLVAPLAYAPFVWLMDKSYLILTDSGGIQEEAPSLGKPVLVMREKTERPEAIESGTAKLVGVNSESIYKEAQLLLKDKERYDEMANRSNPYGDGHASEKIVEIISKNLG